LQRGLRDQARAVRLQFSSAEDVEGELAEMDRAIGEESGSYRELFGRALRKPMTLAILLAIIQQATGINTVLYYGSIVFSEHVGASASGAMGMNIMVGVVNLLFTIAAFFGIDRLGRKPLLLIATAGMGACLTAFSLLLIFHSGNALLLLLPILGYVAFFAFGLGSGVWVCMAELLPNRVRGRAMSVATTVLWIAVSVVAATFLSLIRIFSAPAVFLGYAVICALSYLYIQFNLPETKNRTLEEIARLWQQNRD
jgi:MFS family permease